MRTYDVAIIGAGLAGLECASILSKEGMSVIVLEQGAISGGFFQPFKRRGVLIDSSVHYIGSLDKGQFMERFFSYLNIMDKVDFVRMDNDEFETIYLDGKPYPMAMGHLNFVDKLSEHFPSERRGLEKYIDSIKKISLFSIESVRRGEGFSSDSLDAVTKPVELAISSSISDKRLQRILTGNSIIYCGESALTPFYVHAMTTNSYIESSWKIRGGASGVTEAMAESVKSYGGEVRCNTEIKSILINNMRAVGVETFTGEKIMAKRVISTLHPDLTTKMVGEESGLRESYRRRVSELKNSTSMFCLYIILKRDSLEYLNKNIHIQGESPLMISFQPPLRGSLYADVVTIITPMNFSEVQKWSNSKPGLRGDDYLQFKSEFSEVLINRAEEVLANLRQSIDYTCSASPLTFRDYVKTPQGSVYGVMKDYNKPLSTFLPVKSRVENLYLAGQSVNLHGVMGVTFTSLLTCSEILGNGVVNKMGL
jgi:phytoene dehydrogenase-like protein